MSYMCLCKRRRDSRSLVQAWTNAAVRWIQRRASACEKPGRQYILVSEIFPTTNNVRFGVVVSEFVGPVGPVSTVGWWWSSPDLADEERRWQPSRTEELPGKDPGHTYVEPSPYRGQTRAIPILGQELKVIVR